MILVPKIKGAEKGCVYMYLNCYQIVERMKGEETLKQLATIMQDIFERGWDSIYVRNYALNNVDVNTMWCALDAYFCGYYYWFVSSPAFTILSQNGLAGYIKKYPQGYAINEQYC